MVIFNQEISPNKSFDLKFKIVIQYSISIYYCGASIVSNMNFYIFFKV